jgi:hypothetical protein
VFGEAGDQRQQVALARAVIPDEEDTLVLCWRLELQVWDDQVPQLVSHPRRDHEGLDEMAGGIVRIRLLQLNDGSMGSKWTS